MKYFPSTCEKRESFLSNVLPLRTNISVFASIFNLISPLTASEKGTSCETKTPIRDKLPSRKRSKIKWCFQHTSLLFKTFKYDSLQLKNFHTGTILILFFLPEFLQTNHLTSHALSQIKLFPACVCRLPFD